MSHLKANFATRPSGAHSASQVSVQRQVAVDAAKLAGSIVVFRKKGTPLVVE